MTIEAILQSIDSRLATLIQLSGTPAPVIPQQPASDPFIAGAGAEPAVAEQVNAAIAAAATPAASKRGRGRPAKADAAPAAPAPAPVAPTQPPAPAVDPFAVDAAETAAPPARTLNDVRAALIILQAKTDQPRALKLMKDATGAETLAQLKAEDYGKLFAAAIPSGRLELADVRDILVRANERVANSGMEVLKRFGAKTIVELTEDKFVDAIIAAHQVK